MVERHVYTCRNLENVIRSVAFCVAFFLLFWLDIWVSGYFRRAGPISPVVNTHSVPQIMATTFCALLHPTLFALALPTLGQWLFFRVETDGDGLRYTHPHGFTVSRGFAQWDEITVLYRRPTGVQVYAAGYSFSITFYTTHFQELVQEINSHCPTSRSEEIASEHGLWDGSTLDPAVLEEVHAAVRVRRITEAITILRENTTLDMKTAVDYVDQWGEDNDFGITHRPRPLLLVLFWLGVYAALVLWRLYG